MFDCDEFSLDAHQQVPQHQQGVGQKQAHQQPPMAANTKEAQFDLDSDAGDEDNKLKERMNKKKNREKQRRMDVNSAFTELTVLLDSISPLPSKVSKSTNRIDLIQRTIKVIEDLRDECEGHKRRKLNPSPHPPLGGSTSPFAPPPSLPITSCIPTASADEAPQHPLMMVLPVLSPTTLAPTSCMVYPIPIQKDGAYAIPSATEIGGIFNIPVSSVVAPAPFSPGPSPAIVVGKDADLNKPGMRIEPVLNGEKPKPEGTIKETEVNDFAQCA